MIAPNRGPDRLARPTRLALVGWSLTFGAGFGVARWLRPDPRGFGTHTQMGLWPCGFRAATGRPCPTCGMTTAFAWFVRGEFARSWQSNPAGLAVAVLAAGLMVWLVAVAAWGRPFPGRRLETPLINLAVATVALTVISWTFRFFLG